jgi:hypothetical protein
MTTTLPDLLAALPVRHFPWCTAHQDDVASGPASELCTTAYALAFPVTGRYTDDVRQAVVGLCGSRSDVERGIPVPLATITLNGCDTRELEPWKLVPLAYLLLAAHARATGDVVRARTFQRAAADAADGRDAEHVYTVAPDGPAVRVDAYRDAQASQPVAFDLDDQVVPVEGTFSGQLGVVDELDLADVDQPYRVRFEHVDGEPIAWFNAKQLQRAAVAA